MPATDASGVSRGADGRPCSSVPLVVFSTERSERHQRLALEAAPDGVRVVMLHSADRTELAENLVHARFLISERVGVIDANLLDAAPELMLILRIGSFTHDIDLDAAKRAGIVVCRWPDPGAMRVAEHLILQMLALAKRLGQCEAVVLGDGDWGESSRTDENTFAFNWAKMEGLASLWKKTVGIVGFGEIGAELARRLKGWGCKLLYNRRRRLPEDVEIDLGLTYTDATTVAAEADVLVNLLPYSAENDMSFGRSVLDSMKLGAYLVSCGSGATIDEAAAAASLRSGHLAGIALDTYEWEPVRSSNPLIALFRAGHNVVLTPHIAGGDKVSAAEDRRGYYSVITDHLLGLPLANRLV